MTAILSSQSYLCVKGLTTKCLRMERIMKIPTSKLCSGCRVQQSYRFPIQSSNRSQNQVSGLIFRRLSGVTQSLKRRLVQYVPRAQRPNSQRFFRIDGVSKDYSLIYESVIGDKMFLFFGAYLGLVFMTGLVYAQVVYFLNISLDNGIKYHIPIIDRDVQEAEFLICTCMITTFCLLSFVMYGITVRYINRIYHNVQTDKYIAVVKSRALRKEKIEFEMSEVKPTRARSFLFLRGNIRINEKPYIICNIEFTVNEYFNKMTGLTRDQSNDKKLDERVPMKRTKESKIPEEKYETVKMPKDPEKVKISSK